MLNELAECRIYTSESFQCERIELKKAKTKTSGEKKPKTKTSGVKRALSIVTRSIVYDQVFPDGIPETLSDSDIVEIKEKIDLWINGTLVPAFKKKAKEQSLPDNSYFESIPLRNQEDKKKNSQNKSDLDAITYDRTIAKAINDGPLREQFLVARHVDNDDFLFGPDSHETFIVSNKGNNVKESTRQFHLRAMLKLLAAYLIELNPGCRSSRVILGDVSCWTKKNTSKLDLTNYRFTWIPENGIKRKLFTKESKFSTAKICFNEKFLEKYGWCIMNEQELHEILEKAPQTLYYYDDGYELIRGQ